MDLRTKLFLFSFCSQAILFPQMLPAAPTSADKGRLDTLLAMDLEELVQMEVTVATGTAKPLKLAPAVASVITAEDLEKMGATTLEQALQTVPGLYISEYFINGTPIYSMRGIHSLLNSEILLQINGLPQNSATSARIPSTLTIPVSTISRIEIVRGPGSAVHGADAFAGTINVITKDSQEIGGTETGLRYGSFDSAEAWLLHGKSYGGWDMMASIDYSATDGDDDRIITSDLQTSLDKSLNIPFGLPPASLAPGPVQSQEENLDMRLNLSRDSWTMRFWGSLSNDYGLGVGLTPVLDTWGSVDSEMFQADLAYATDELLQDTELSARLSYLYSEEDSIARMFPPGALVSVGQDGNLFSAPAAGLVLFTDGVFGEPISAEHQPALDLAALYSGVAGHRLRMGAGAKYFKLETDNYKNFGPGVIDTRLLLPPPAINSIDGTLTHLTHDSPSIYLNNQERDLWYALLQDEWAFAANWVLTAGVRYDQYSDFGSTTNPRVALVWETRPDLVTKLLYGSAFRAPAFGELYLQNNPSALGNPDLAPETIDTVELAFDYQPTSTFLAKFNIFAYELDDLIERVPDAGRSTLTSRNSRDQEGRGVELEAAWQVTDSFQLRGNVAYQQSEDRDTGARVPDAPRWQTYLNADWNFQPHWFLDGQWFWIADRPRAGGDPRPDVDDYSLVNLTLRRTDIADNWDVALLAKNLLDQDIYEPTDSRIPGDYPMEGRSLFAEVRYHF